MTQFKVNMVTQQVLGKKWEGLLEKGFPFPARLVTFIGNEREFLLKFFLLPFDRVICSVRTFPWFDHRNMIFFIILKLKHDVESLQKRLT